MFQSVCDFRIFKKKNDDETTSPQGGERDVYDESTDEETEGSVLG